MITLYGAPASVFVRKARILLQEKGVKFIVEPTNPMLPVADDFQRISPLKKIPALKDDDFYLADSSAICAYIERKYPDPSFYPQDPKLYGQSLWFEEYADTALFQAIAPIYYQTVLAVLYRNRKPDQEAIDNALTHHLPPVANYLENALRGKSFLVGSQFTIADISVVSVFLNMVVCGYPLDSRVWPNLSAYLNCHFQRMSFKQCFSEVEYELNHAIQALRQPIQVSIPFVHSEDIYTHINSQD